MPKTGLRGNVSTYHFLTLAIVDLVSDNVLAHDPVVFSTLIGATIVGARNIPERTLKGLLRVQRERVRLVLVWLKKNNYLYSNIAISESRLMQFPKDRVPPAILSNVRLSDDIDELEKERDTYVPNQEENVDGESFLPKQGQHPYPLSEPVVNAGGVLDVEERLTEDIEAVIGSTACECFFLRTFSCSLSINFNASSQRRRSAPCFFWCHRCIWCLPI